jgi:hypothetical protein
MWKALKKALIQVTIVIVRGLACWMEALSKYPGLSRDSGMAAWSELHRRAARHEDAERSDDAGLPAGEIRRRYRTARRFRPRSPRPPHSLDARGVFDRRAPRIHWDFRSPVEHLRR